MKPNVMILGVNGMLGSMLVKRWNESGRFRLFAGVRSQASPRLDGPLVAVCQGLDAAEFGQVDQFMLADFVRTHGIGVLVNCIGVIKQRPDGQDPVVTTAVNALFPHQVAQICSKVGAKLIHVSTDCVFTGETGSYLETDPTDAADFYGRSKALGEVGAPNLTLRTSIIGPELEGSEGLGLLAWLLRQKGPAVNGYTKAVFSGVTTLTLAGLIEKIIIEHPELTGLFHVASEPIDKCSLLNLINSEFKLGLEVMGDDTVRIDRSLNGEKLKTAIGYVAPGWSHQIASLYRQVNTAA